MFTSPPFITSKDFIWSTTGTNHVDYSPSEAFKGDAATVGRAGHLGSGGFGSVDAVICNGQILTRKRMYFARLDEDCREEAEILEGIIHPHIVQLVGSYTSQSRFYMLLHPVAECNLKEYIQTPEEQRTSLWEQQLKSSFGCLAAAVAFLHSKKIAVKHKDIKPTNVLMFSDTPMLTDFGLSTSFKNRDNSVSVGFTGKTTFYASPEVIAALLRGTSQDVFSWAWCFRTCIGHSMATPLGGQWIPKATTGRGLGLAIRPVMRSERLPRTFRYSRSSAMHLSLERMGF
jgi:serine/threonine protein kinase